LVYTVKKQSYFERKLQNRPEKKKLPTKRTNSYGAYGRARTDELIISTLGLKIDIG
jgi:hypothetical protein